VKRHDFSGLEPSF